MEGSTRMSLCALVLLWVAIGSVSPANEGETKAKGEREPTLSGTFREINQTFKESGRREIDVDLEGTVIHVGSDGTLLRLQDESGFPLLCAVAKQAPSTQSLKLGDRIRILGITESANKRVLVHQWQHLGNTDPVVAPLRWNSDSIANRVGDYVEVSGFVRDIMICTSHTYLSIKCGQRHAIARLRNATSQLDFQALLGAAVRLRGTLVKNSFATDSVLGNRVELMDDSQLEAIEAEFDKVLPSLNRNWETEEVKGIVEGMDPIQAIFSDARQIRTTLAFVARRGQRISGSMFYKTKSKELTMSCFLVEGGDKPTDPQPVAVTPHLAHSASHRLVTIEGIVKRWKQQSYWAEGFLESEGTLFRVIVPTYRNASLESEMARFEIGSLVRSTGIVTKANASRSPDEAFILRVDAPSSMILVKDSLSLVREPFLRWIGLAGAIVAVSVGGSVLLQKQVARRTKQLEEMSLLMKSAGDAIRDGILMFSPDGRLISYNGIANQLLDGSLCPQCSQHQVLLALESLLGSSRLLTDFWRSTFANPDFIAEKEFRAPHERTWLQLYTAPIFHPRRPSLGRIVTVRDVSKVREMEAERLHSQKIQAIGRLAGGVAHDFNNLLAGIASNLSLAEMKENEQQAKRQHLRIAQSIVQRASKLTKHLLGFARQSELEVDIVDAAKIVEEVHGFLQYTLDSTIQLSVTVASEACFCRADAGQLEQVLINLCLNARDALVDGHGRIAIEVRQVSHEVLGDCVCIAVEDDGIGISPDMKERIFEPFFTTKEMGTGLGLSIGLGVVHQLGGSLECCSLTGRGSRFQIVLPRLPAISIAPPDAETTMAASAEESPSLRVLLVDDDPVLQDCGSELLKLMGHRVECAGNGKEALERLAASADFDVVVLDMTMPVLSGSETLAAIRQSYPQLRVVVCSGYSVRNQFEDSGEHQPDAILAKPFQFSDLKRVLAA